MPKIDDIDYRRAELKDVFPILQLYQLATPNPGDPVLLDYRKLEEELKSMTSVWIVADRGGEFVAALSILVEHEHRLAKINRFMASPRWKDPQELLKQSLPLLIQYLKEKKVEVVYTTTKTLTLTQQEMTLEMGFKVLGVFPNASGADPLKLNGIAAYFFDDVLEKRRHDDFPLHPSIAPFYEIARKYCGLAALPPADAVVAPTTAFEPLPRLEIIHAAAFVAHRYRRLKDRRSLSVNFYPFHEPNALVTDPEQKIEIFVRIIPEIRFAAIIGERLDRAVDPVELYNEVAMMLNRGGVSFVEVINDAADPFGIDCLLNAGFIPCAYFPVFKYQADKRRDFVILARSFERMVGIVNSPQEVNRAYLEYLAEYYRLDEKVHLTMLRTRTS